MGLPDNRDIEQVRDDIADVYEYEPEVVINMVVRDEQVLRMDVDEESNNEGYERLQAFDNDDQPADDSDSDFESDEEDANEVGIDAVEVAPSDVPSILNSEAEIQAEVWNTPRSQDTIELNTEKSQQIMKAMSSFSLPNVPQWAQEVNPTELIERIRNREAPAKPSEKK